MRMEKLLASTQEKVVELTNINTSLGKTLAAKKEEADNTRTELEKALVTLAEREAARDQLSGQVTHYRAVLAQTETALTSLQTSVEEEEMNLDNANWELDNTRQELDTAYEELDSANKELEKANRKLNNVNQEVSNLKLENSKLCEEQRRPKVRRIELDLRESARRDKKLELSIFEGDKKYDFRITGGQEDTESQRIEDFIADKTGILSYLEWDMKWEVI